MTLADKAEWKACALALPITAAAIVVDALTGFHGNFGGGMGVGMAAGSQLGIWLYRREWRRKFDPMFEDLKRQGLIDG